MLEALSVTKEKHSLKWQAQALTGVYGVQLVPSITIALHRNGLSPALMAIFIHNAKDQEPSIDYKRGAHQVPIYGISTSTSSCLYLDKHAQFFVNRVYLIAHQLLAVLPKENGQANSFIFLLACLYAVAELFETRTQMS